MNGTWENLLIAAAGTAIGVTATLLSEEIKAWLGWLGYSNRDLRGQWHCVWHVEWPNGTVYREIVDTVDVRHAGKRQILAQGGSGAAASYELRGSMSRANILTLTYESKQARNLSGVVIITLDIMRHTFSGFWLQVDPEGVIRGGRTTWQKGLRA